MSTPVNYSTAKVGARVIVRTSIATCRGILVGATEARASIKCDDGKRRSVPWLRTVITGWRKIRSYESSVYMLSDEEVWAEQRPALSTMSYSLGSMHQIEFSISSIGTDEFRADMAALVEWASKRPSGEVTS